ncbi:MAG TPA: hypothetical protein VHT51_08560 [Micropepsaceae bacterium]|jgi:hypothetical protein|nr:hypothetical protein [Micropepsaceae bacterium]
MLNSHRLVSAVAASALAGVSLALLALSPASSAPAPQRGEAELVDRAQPADLDYTVSKDGLPNLASTQFAWLSDGADWMDPPPGTPGHGRIKNDPDHPFLGNVDAIRLGRQPTLRIGDAKDPVLKPWAAKVMADSNEEALSKKLDVPFAAQARCWPGGVPGQLLYPAEPFYFIQTPKEVWMIWQRDHMVRRIYLTDKHTPSPKPQSFGESIGHYEGNNTLVVDTIGLATKNNYIDNFRTPHTTKEHVVERFTISPDGKKLSAVVMVEDPDTFNEPLHMMQTWHKVRNPLLETVCAENNNDSLFFHQKLFPMPEATKADF